MPQMIGLVVHDPARVDEIVRAWVAAGVPGMTFLDSSGLGHHLRDRDARDDLPLFPSVRRLLRDEEEQGRLVFSLVPDGFDVDAIAAITEQVLGPLSNPGTGILFVIPGVRVVGLQPAQGQGGEVGGA
jgi:nitrogen regulatory protein P-II 1